MADKKISELDPITGATVAADDVFVVVDTSGGVTRKITHDELKIALALGDTPQFNQINMADDAKILMGDSNDLQLYHESSTGNSYIADKGTGELRLEASSLIRMMGNNGETIAVFNEDGAVSLRYDGSSKIATSATGIDVTGTATMDGLTVDGGTSDLRLDSTGVYSSTAVSTSQLTVKNFDSTTAYTPSVLSFQARGSTTTSSSWQLGNAGLDTAYSESDFFIKNRIGSSAYRQRLLIEGTGDISFYEDTGSDVKFFWDASAESLGIGTDSPSAVIHAYTAALAITPLLKLQANISDNTGTQGASIDFVASGDATAIGSRIVATRSAAGANMDLRFHTGRDAERMRVDSSGNLMVGKTDVITSVVGHAFMSNGSQRSTVDGDTVAVLNRETSDGIIQQFRKDNSVVGNIGSYAGTRLRIGSSAGAGMLFGGTQIYPATDGTLVNDTHDLGTSSYRWKDLYLSGGVYLGGTAGANKLDDYEEGSYIVQFFDASAGGNASATTTTGYYTKIGNQVTVRFDALNNISTAGMTGTNVAYLPLPFNASSTGRSVGSIIMDNLNFTTGRNVVAPVVLDTASRAHLITMGDGVTDANVNVEDITSGQTDIHTYTLTYFTA